MFSRLYINDPLIPVLQLSLSQSHLPGKNAAQFSAAVAIHTVLLETTCYTITTSSQNKLDLVCSQSGSSTIKVETADWHIL